MKSKKALDLIAQIQSDIQNDEVTLEGLIEQLTTLREHAKEEKDPALVKLLRLTIEHLSQFNGFHIAFLEDAEDLGISDFEYLLKLIEQSENELNREELLEIRELLQNFVPEE